jgi:hypothetical protein
MMELLEIATTPIGKAALRMQSRSFKSKTLRNTLKTALLQFRKACRRASQRKLALQTHIIICFGNFHAFSGSEGPGAESILSTE